MGREIPTALLPCLLSSTLGAGLAPGPHDQPVVVDKDAGRVPSSTGSATEPSTFGSYSRGGQHGLDVGWQPVRVLE